MYSELELLNKWKTLKSERLTFFGYIILCTKYEFSTRASLWSEAAPTKYEKAVAFGQFGMPRAWFDKFWQSICFGDQHKVRPVGMSPE
jgi:hypothetical protein